MSKLKGIFSASMSIMNKDLSLDIKATIEHAKNVDKFGVGPAFLGSTSQAQLCTNQDKKDLIKELLKHKFENPVLIGTGCNSLKENINLIRYSLEKGFKGAFLLMNPAYYKNEDSGVYDFFSNIIKTVSCKIVLYNFDKLSGYAFSSDIVKKLVDEYGTEHFVGMKDSSGNLWNKIKISNFSMFVGSELKLLKNLELGGAGCISATTNISHYLARKVYDDFENKKEQTVNSKLCAVRKAFDDTGNLIAAVHDFMSVKDAKYKRLLPPLNLLPVEKKKELLNKLKELDFIPKKNIAA